MKTDWNLVRSMMDTAIDACEAIEAMGYTEAHRVLAASIRRPALGGFTRAGCPAPVAAATGRATT